jgi:hypothetical protein
MRDGSERESLAIELGHSNYLLRLKVRGPLTDLVLGDLSRTVRSLPEFKAGCAFLLDLTEITDVELSSGAITLFARGAQRDVNRIAILTNNITAFGWAQIYEIIADLEQNRIRVFTDEASAMTWVSQNRQEL